MNPIISIIVPIYNVEQYLNKCIDSILAQTFTKFELILVNDGSPDNCGEICDQYKLKDNRVKVIHKKNGGVADARNAGIDVAKGNYIGFVDSDDWIEPNMYEILYDLIVEHKTGISACSIQSPTNDKKVNSDEINILDSGTAINLIYEGKPPGFGPCNKLYLKNLFQEIRFPINRDYDDAAIMYQLFDKAEKIVMVDFPLYNYTYRDSSITKSPFSENRFDLVVNYYETYSFMEKYYPDMRDKIVDEYYSSLRTMVVDIVNEKSILKNYKYIRRISKLIKKDNNRILKCNLISIRKKLLSQILIWCPILAILLYKICDIIFRFEAMKKNGTIAGVGIIATILI
ncbi:glycosyltransferase [Siminovitchia acidinfaciens]|uniref:Glycosyltransferase n=1 Tax=Siminovitchia acidinfaciens TaxID=2321395 RepID=A0A429XW30_9BACI|nr:glycosyltransferase [Siminovitchia acidinfaciens]RST72559.1 glycosyltransferase [Siminovitchia acidinfaciens]